MRLLLEVAYESLENGTCCSAISLVGTPLIFYPLGGITPDAIAGSKTGVYMGVFSDDYGNLMLADPESLPPHHVTGTGKAIFANRISYYFNLKGPSFSLDTGCSASLVALHQACQSIRCGESKQAIVGGTNLILSPKTMMSLGGLGCVFQSVICWSLLMDGSDFSPAMVDATHLTAGVLATAEAKGWQASSSSRLKTLLPMEILSEPSSGTPPSTKTEGHRD